MKKKLISIIFITIFSIILWGSISLSGDYFTTVKFPVNFVNVPDGYAVGSYSTDMVSLIIKGQGWEIAKLSFGRDLTYSVSAKNKSGSHQEKVRNSLNLNDWVSSLIQIVEISPENIDFTVERIKSKKIIVEPDISFDFKPGYGIVSGIKLEPDSIEISGPVNLINSIDTIRTQRKNFHDLEQNVNSVLKLEAIKHVDFSNTITHINFEVQKIVDKTLDDILVETRNVPSSRELILFPNRIRLVLRGGINVLGKITKDDVEVYVDFYKALRDNSGSIEPVIEVPDNTVVIDKKPNKLEYIIKQF